MANRPSNVSSSRPSASPQPPRNAVNTQTTILDSHAGRILCLADIRGHLSNLNELAKEANAKAIIHTGDFGFFDNSSLPHINDRTLRHLILYSPLVPADQRTQLLADGTQTSTIRDAIYNSSTPLLSQFPLLLSGKIKLSVPVYTVWGACEDVSILEKFRSGEYDIENLHVIDEATTRCLDVGGVKLRLLGLGGALVPHKMFDNGDGQATIAGGQGTMWTTALQIGELVDTAQRVHDPSETRLLISHASPGREGLLAQLGLVVKADLTISAGLHFRYASSYNEFSVQADMDGFRQKLVSGKESFDKVWENVKTQVEAVIDENQKLLLEKALLVSERVPSTGIGPGGNPAGEEPAWKNCWNWNLCDAAYGSLVLDIKDGRVSAELKSQGFNYAYRRTSTPTTAATPASASHALPNAPPQHNAKVAPPASSQPASRTVSATHAPGPDSASPAVVKPPVANKDRPIPNGAPSSSLPGTATPSSPSTTPGGDKPGNKKKSKKEKERERERAGSTTGATPDGADKAAGPTKAQKTPPQEIALLEGGADSEPMSPAVATESTGTRTPLNRRPPRNPWTLYVSRIPVPLTEDELRDFFGEAKGGITSIKIPTFPDKSQKRSAFVEFGDEEAMREGIAKHDEKLKDSIPKVSVAENREDFDGNRPFRGDGGGRGFRGSRGGRGGYGRGGALAAVQAAAGSTGGGRGGKRQNSGPIHNGDSHPSGEGNHNDSSSKKDSAPAPKNDAPAKET